MIEAQTVRAKPISFDLGETGNGGEQVALGFSIIEGPNAGEQITWFGSFSEKALPITVKALRACGMAGNDLANPGNVDNEVLLVIEHNEYQGKTSARVKWVNSLGVHLRHPMSKDRKISFAARMQGKIAALSAGKGMSSPPPPSDNDIPWS